MPKTSRAANSKTNSFFILYSSNYFLLLFYRIPQCLPQAAFTESDIVNNRKDPIIKQGKSHSAYPVKEKSSPRQGAKLPAAPQRGHEPIVVTYGVTVETFGPNEYTLLQTYTGEKYIIDWAHVTQGNASADAARTYLIFKLHKKDQIAEQYLELFCKKSGISKQNVQLWMPIVAASQLAKGKPEEKEFLESWVDVVDYQ